MYIKIYVHTKPLLQTKLRIYRTHNLLYLIYGMI